MLPSFIKKLKFNQILLSDGHYIIVIPIDILLSIKDRIDFTTKNRIVDPLRIDTFSNSFDIRLVGTLKMCFYSSEDETLELLDGQHRYRTLLEMEEGGTLRDCDKATFIPIEILHISEEEFPFYLEKLNDTLPLSLSQREENSKIENVKRRLKERIFKLEDFKIFNEENPHSIKTIFGRNRPRISENVLLKIKTSSIFRNESEEEIVDKLVKINSKLKKIYSYENYRGELDKVLVKYIDCGFYLGFKAGWVDEYFT